MMNTMKIDNIRDYKNELYHRISVGLDRELQKQKEDGKEFITDEELDSIIIRILNEENHPDSTVESPYIKVLLPEYLGYNPRYGDDRICICGHSYYRHFDTYDNMRNVGCKYCQCSEFVEDLNKLKK